MNCFKDPAIGERELSGKKADPQNKQVKAGGIDQLWKDVWDTVRPVAEAPRVRGHDAGLPGEQISRYTFIWAVFTLTPSDRRLHSLASFGLEVWRPRAASLRLLPPSVQISFPMGAVRRTIGGFTGGVRSLSPGQACLQYAWKASLPIFFYFAQKTLPVFPKQNEVQVKVLNIGNSSMTVSFPGSVVTLPQMTQVSRRKCNFPFSLLTWVIIGLGETDLLNPYIIPTPSVEVKCLSILVLCGLHSRPVCRELWWAWESPEELVKCGSWISRSEILHF